MKTRTCLLSFALAGVVLSQTLYERESNWTIGQTVQTTSGAIIGHAASIATEVSEYLGIPYAIPPVGELRWTAPQKYIGNSVLSGALFGFSCPANLVTYNSTPTVGGTSAILTPAGIYILQSLAQVGDLFDENCLTINVWTKPQVGEDKKAVLVWIYGGSFTTGNSDNPGFRGQYIVDQEDVILVSFNYRLNIFGFPGAPNLTQNLGLLDQRLAIEWVRDNIAKFGGDPSRITLFGQSAGGASVDYFSYAWTEDPIAHAFISQSGTAISNASGLGHMSASDGAELWSKTAALLGCGGSSTSPSIVLTCMRGKPTALIISTIGIFNFRFGPTVDETIVFSDYIERSQAGNFTRRPLLIGNTDNEASFFEALAALGGSSLPDTTLTSLNQDSFDCPAAARANISYSNGIPTWRYRWFGVFPNTRLTFNLDNGAWHASELPSLFDTPPVGFGVPNNTPEEIAIGKYLRGAWATFAKDPVDGLSNYKDGWPTYNAGDQTLIRLAYQNLTGTNLAQGNTYDASCALIFPANGSPSTSPSPTLSTSASTTGTIAPTKSSSGARGSSASHYLLVLVFSTTSLLW